MTIIAAADGSALGNPGPAGWGWYVDEDRWASGGWAHGTNNMGELMAVLDLLQQTAHLDEELHIFCDSTYVINAVTKWMAGWKRKGWKTGSGQPVKNVELMKALDIAMEGRRGRVKFEWVKGHAGHELNEAADRLANAAALAFKEGRTALPGPGFPGRPLVEEGRSPVTKPDQDEPDLFSDLEEVTEPSDEEQVIELERSLLTDEVRSDRASVAALLHPQWQVIGRSGRVWSREEMLDQVGPIEAVTLDVLSVSEVAPGAILLVWRASTDERTTLRSSLWLRGPSGWQQAFHQGTDEG